MHQVKSVIRAVRLSTNWSHRSVVIVLVSCFGLFPLYYGSLAINRFSATSLNNTHTRQYAIATLIRSTNRSVSLTINMIHSISKYYNVSGNRSFAIVVFHDQNLTSDMRSQILSCVLRANQNLTILFGLVDFDASPSLINPQSLIQYKLGYRIMSRFWSHDVFFHPIIVQGQFDYLMRMDDDSYFSDTIQEDLVTYMERQGLDYIFRAWYGESATPMLPVLKLFLGKEVVDNRVCVYNNFFVIRLDWLYQSTRIRAFLRELIRDNRMIREYIGDGCVHAAMLKIDTNGKSRLITHISYGHNLHTMDTNASGYQFGDIGFHDAIRRSCTTLTIIRGMPRRLLQIKLVN